jgi:hypothetical protein
MSSAQTLLEMNGNNRGTTVIAVGMWILGVIIGGSLIIVSACAIVIAVRLNHKKDDWEEESILSTSAIDCPKGPPVYLVDDITTDTELQCCVKYVVADRVHVRNGARLVVPPCAMVEYELGPLGLGRPGSNNKRPHPTFILESGSTLSSP